MSIFDRPTNSRRTTEPPRVRWYDFPDDTAQENSRSGVRNSVSTQISSPSPAKWYGYAPPSGPTMEQTMSRAYDTFIAKGRLEAQLAPAEEKFMFTLNPYSSDPNLPPKPPMTPPPGPDEILGPPLLAVPPVPVATPVDFGFDFTPPPTFGEVVRRLPYADDPRTFMLDELEKWGLTFAGPVTDEAIAQMYDWLHRDPSQRYVEPDYNFLERMFNLVSGAIARSRKDEGLSKPLAMLIRG